MREHAVWGIDSQGTPTLYVCMVIGLGPHRQESRVFRVLRFRVYGFTAYEGLRL